MSRGVLAWAVGLGLLALAACSNESRSSGGGGTGATGSNGTGGSAGCPMGPHAALNLTISAPNGPVPADTTLDVSWSGGQEPTFALDDPTTWSTLDQGANVVCKVDASAPPPTDLGQLVCHLWTLGPTHVTVHASGFATFDQTLSPDVSERCDEPVPTDEDIVLIPLGDAGAGS